MSEELNLPWTNIGFNFPLANPKPSPVANPKPDEEVSCSVCVVVLIAKLL